MNEIFSLLGKTVVDATSGFKGTVIQIMENFSGNTQIGIQPKVAEGTNTYPEAMFLDHHLIDVVDDGVRDRVTPVPARFELALGELAEDTINGFRGIATARATYMNGCEAFCLERKFDPSAENQKTAEWVSTTRLKKVEAPAVPQKVPPKADNGKVPGGPAVRMSNR